MKQNFTIQKIISGGQTGADRAAFDFALEHGIEMGGYVPKGRRAEDGRISDKYSNLIETGTTDYAKRTELNVINSDITIIFFHGKLTGGSLLTRKLARRHIKPCLQINPMKKHLDKTVPKVRDTLAEHNYKIINIAGPRASEDDRIYQKTKDFLSVLFASFKR